MKRILLLVTLAIGMMACSNDTVIEKYEVKISNGVETNNTRGTTKLCGDVAERGVEKVNNEDVNYYWVVVCRPKI